MLCNLCFLIDQIKADSFVFCEPTKNVIITNAQFVKILYINTTVYVSSVFIVVPIQHIAITQIYDVYKITMADHVALQLKQLEEKILCNYKTFRKIQNTKKPIYKVFEQLKAETLKIDSQGGKPATNVVLKISGVWEMSGTYGLTFKFYFSTPCINHR